MRNKKSFITSPKVEQQEQAKTPKDLVTIILLSENHGHRMKSYGPLSLLKLGSKTLLEKQIETIISTFENYEIIICSGFETIKTTTFVKSKFSDLNIRIVENQMHYNSNCCESARLCLNNTMNNKIIICGGGVLAKPTHFSSIDYNRSCVLMQNQISDSNFEIGIIENNSILENFSIGIKNKYWSEIFYLNGFKEISLFSSIVSDADFKNRFLFEALNEFNKKQKLKVVQTQNPLIKIDNIKTLKRIMQ
jgi:choline kinase